VRPLGGGLAEGCFRRGDGAKWKRCSVARGWGLLSRTGLCFCPLFVCRERVNVHCGARAMFVLWVKGVRQRGSG